MLFRSFRYDENDKYNLHFSHPVASITYFTNGCKIPDRPIGYLIETILRELNKELEFRTRGSAFGGNSYIPEDVIYFTIDGVYGKAVLENGEYIYKE